MFYPSTITFFNRTLDYLARLIRRHRTSIGSAGGARPATAGPAGAGAFTQRRHLPAPAAGFGIGLAPPTATSATRSFIMFNAVALHRSDLATSKIGMEKAHHQAINIRITVGKITSTGTSCSQSVEPSTGAFDQGFCYRSRSPSVRGVHHSIKMSSANG